MIFNSIAIALPTLCLMILILRAIVGIVSDSLQNRNAKQSELNKRTQTNTELANRLYFTQHEVAENKRKSKWRELLILRVVQESEDVKSFYLVDESFEPLPKARPGQHILVRREKQSGILGGSRCYTLSDDCASDHWRISVKKNSDNPESLSRWLHEEKVAGDTLNVKGPSGTFFLESALDRIPVLVSAGVGITPMLPMLMEAIRQKHPHVRCFTQCRDLEHMPFADSLIEVARKYPHVNLQIWVSRWPKGVRRPNGGMFLEGKFQSNDLVRHAGSISQSDYYLCGPEKWQDAIKASLIQEGVHPNSIRYELFQQSEKTVPVQSHESHCIHFRQSGTRAKFESSCSSVLACAGKTGVEMESGCRTGACGSCAIKLLKGEVRYTREPQFQIPTSEILPCVCVPVSDLEVDA